MIRKIAAAISLALLLTVINGCAGKGGKALTASGNIEATEIQVASERAGQVLAVKAGEGDRVTSGTLLVEIDSSVAALQLKEADAAVKGAEARLRDLRAGARTQQIAEAEAAVEQALARQQAAMAEASNASTELERVKKLFDSGAATRQELDRLSTRYKTSKEQQGVAEAGYRAARAQADLVRAGATRASIEALEANLEQARAARELAALQIEKSTIKAPASGVILKQNVRPGELVNPGTPVLTLADLENLWVTVYIPEPDLGRVQLGQKAGVRVDAFPKETFEGKVIFISPEAEFTPKNVVTVSERVKTVFAVKVSLGSGGGKLKPGMPADVEFEAVEVK